jgi:hypothetical protein
MMMKRALPLIATVTLLLACLAAAAGERPGRLVVDIKIDGKGHQKNGGAYSTFTSAEQMHAAATLLSSGVPEDTNRLDMAGNAAAMQKQANEAKARAPDRAGQEAYMERAKAAMAACAGNTACMTQVAQKMGRETSSWNVRPPNNSANAGRFLTYAMSPAAVCKGEFDAKLKTEAEGKFPDVQGLVPFTSKTNADYHASELQKNSLCNGTIVFDTRNDRIFAYVPMVEIKGQKLRMEGSYTAQDNKDGEVRMNQDALAWAEKQLQNAPRSGKQRTTLKIPTDTPLGGVGEKIINVEMSWSFESK